MRGFLLSTTAAVAGSPLNITAALVEASAALVPTVTTIGATQSFDLTLGSVVVTDTALAPLAGSKCIKAEFTAPIVFTGPPRRVFLCVVYQPNWTTANTTNIVRPQLGAAQYFWDMGAAYSGVLPATTASAAVVVADKFLSFDPHLHLDTGS